MNDSTRRHFETTILRRLASLGRRVRLYLLLDGLAVLIAVGVAFMLITLGVDYFARLDWDMRVAQLASIAVVLVAVGWRFLIRPLLVPVRRDQLAVLVERKYPQLHSLLVTAVDFLDKPVKPPVSPGMVEHVIHRATHEAAELPFHAVLAHGRARQRAAISLACLSLVVAFALAAPQTMGLWMRRNLLLESVPWPQRNRLTVENLVDGRLVVPRNEDVTISAVVDPGYEPPRQVFIEHVSTTGARSREQMPAMSHGDVRFTHTFERLAQSRRCRITGGDATTDWFEIQVVDRPQIKRAVIEIAPPAYTGMEAYELRPGQTAAEVLVGSEVRFRIEANKPLVRATLVQEEPNRETEIAEAAVRDGVYLDAAVTPAATSTYQFLLLDELGLTNRSERLVPVRFNVRLVADKPPVVKMRVKDAGDMITKDAILPVEATFNDQYGLATAAIACEITREGASPQPFNEPIPGFTPGTRSFTRTIEWSGAAHGLTESDRLTLFCEARDYDDVSGPNVGKSAPLSFRVVSHEELLAELSRREQEHRRDFERLLRQQEELFSEMLATSRPSDPDEARDYYPRLARRQRDHAGRLNLLRLQFEQVLAKLRINQLATPAVEVRLGDGVIAPMDELYRSGMPHAAATLEQLPPDATGAALNEARAAQQQVLAEMNRILASLLKWEGYQEAVTLLREVIKMQKALEQETEAKIEEQIFGIETEDK
ncbi:MAG TPA: hypothetical protein PLV57_01535 [Phycisphaerae bacterium]|mgnify:FL=1|nr:hypothetical protein [Phycisphaerae bacterium]HON66809.1 hypothetical protein [Phycisphaerae bacterium]HPP25172.1 hypothetical protein [Phycisphaerae bacterium]